MSATPTKAPTRKVKTRKAKNPDPAIPSWPPGANAERNSPWNVRLRELLKQMRALGNEIAGFVDAEPMPPGCKEEFGDWMPHELNALHTLLSMVTSNIQSARAWTDEEFDSNRPAMLSGE